jgi:hypothetical protein
VVNRSSRTPMPPERMGLSGHQTPGQRTRRGTLHFGSGLSMDGRIHGGQSGHNCPRRGVLHHHNPSPSSFARITKKYVPRTPSHRRTLCNSPGSGKRHSVCYQRKVLRPQALMNDGLRQLAEIGVLGRLGFLGHPARRNVSRLNRVKWHSTSERESWFRKAKNC